MRMHCWPRWARPGGREGGDPGALLRGEGKRALKVWGNPQVLLPVRIHTSVIYMGLLTCLSTLTSHTESLVLPQPFDPPLVSTHTADPRI